MDWTIFWTIFVTILWGGHTISNQGGVGYSLSVLREGWEAECYYSGRDCSEGWVVIVNTTGRWSFYSIVQITSIGFSTELFVIQNFCAGPQRFFSFLSCESETAT